MSGLDPALRRQVGAARVARLATVRPDATPHIVPIAFALLGRSIVTAVGDKPKTTTALPRLRNIAANPAVSVLIDHYDDDWNQLWWVRADGTATIADAETAPDTLDVLAAKYQPYRNRTPQGPVIVVTVDRWTAWSASRTEDKRGDMGRDPGPPQRP